MSKARSSLVFLTSECPFPATRGAHIRDSHLVNILAESHDIELVCERGSSAPTHEIPRGTRIQVVDLIHGPSWQRIVENLRPAVQGGFNECVARALAAAAQPGKLLWISRLEMAKYIELARGLGYRTILDQHQVETNVMWKNGVQAASRPTTLFKGMSAIFKAAQCGYYEGRICREADAVVAASDLDATRLQRLAPTAYIQVVPQSIDSEAYRPIRSAAGSSILFSGALNLPSNIEGLEWFLSEVLPRIRGARPRLVVAGSNPSLEVRRRLESSGAELHVDPPSLLPLLENAAVVISPLRSGHSQRYKILEAMASARAVVSTPRGCEGLILAPGYDIWIADGVDTFASAVIKLLENPMLRFELGAHAAQTIDSRYDWRKARAQIDTLLDRIQGDSDR